MTIFNWLTLLGVPGIITALATFIRLQVKQNKAVREGLEAILRDRLLTAYRHYEDQGFADSDDRQNWEHMYIQYHALGGNGIIDNLRQRLFEMPFKSGPTSGSGRS